MESIWSFLCQLFNNICQAIKETDVNLLIVITIAFSGMISLLLTWYLHNTGYKYEYYKKLIDKRLNNYELAEDILRQMRLWFPFNGKTYHSFFYTWDKFQSFYKEVLNICEVGFWLDKNTLSEFLKLNGTLFGINLTFKNKEDSKLIGIAHHEELCKQTKAIENSLYSDFKNLHKIRSFINRRANAKA